VVNVLSRIIEYFSTQGFARALRHRDFMWFSMTSWISTTGMWMQRVGVGWLTWELTHSGAWLGIMAAANALPGLVLLPFTGAYADRIDRLKLMRVTQSLNFVANAVLAVLTLTGHISVEIMFAITLLSGVVQTFNMPVRMTIAPSLVPLQDLPAAISVNSFQFTTAMFIGPALAGFMIAHGGVGLAFVANAASYLPFYIILYVITLADRPPRPQVETGIIADVVDGIKYAANHPGIGPVLMATLLLSILVRPLSDLVPGFIDEVFQKGPAELGLVLSAYGCGGMVGSFWMGNRGRLQGSTRIFIVCSLILTAFTVVFASINVILPAIALMAVLGASNSISNNAAQSMIQASVAPSHRGRVISLYSLNGRAGPALGALVMGYMSHVLGLQIPTAGAAVIGIFVVLYVARDSRKIAEATEAVIVPYDKSGAARRGAAKKDGE
jgi:MFS family permease